MPFAYLLCQNVYSNPLPCGTKQGLRKQRLFAQSWLSEGSAFIIVIGRDPEAGRGVGELPSGEKGARGA